MVLFQAFTGTVTGVRDARGAHDLVFGANDRAGDLHSMAPGIFVGGGTAPVSCTYGQFASLLLGSVARLSPAGALNKTFATHRCSDAALGRLWSTALEVLVSLSLGDQQIFDGQRGEFLAQLSHLRTRASAAQLARLEISDSDLEPITTDIRCGFGARGSGTETLKM